MKSLIAIWNRSYYYKRHSNPRLNAIHRRDDIRHEMRQRMRCKAAGKGNKAWKRYEAMLRDHACIVWPDYAI